MQGKAVCVKMFYQIGSRGSEMVTMNRMTYLPLPDSVFLCAKKIWFCLLEKEIKFAVNVLHYIG